MKKGESFLADWTAMCNVNPVPGNIDRDQSVYIWSPSEPDIFLPYLTNEGVVSEIFHQINYFDC